MYADDLILTAQSEESLRDKTVKVTHEIRLRFSSDADIVRLTNARIIIIKTVIRVGSKTFEHRKNEGNVQL